MVDDTIMNEYEKALHFLEVGCGCGCSAKLPKEEFAELREDFQALTKPEQDIFLMAQLRSMDGGAINTSRRLKSKLGLTRELSTAEIVTLRFVKKPTSICWALAAIILKTSEITRSRMVFYHGSMVM